MMRKSLRISLLLLIPTVVGVGKANAQVDPHFTQYYAYPAWLNPALTGAFDGQYRVSGIYRSQWGNISSPFTTPGFSLEYTTDKNINLGVSVLNQKAGNGGYNYTTAYGNISYTGLRFGPNDAKRITFGFQAGMIQRRFDRDKLTFGDQWNPITGYNPSNQTAELLQRTTATNLDASFGVMYFDAQGGKKSNVFVGAALSHLTEFDDDFSGGAGTQSFPMRYTVHGGVRFTINPVFSITPNFLWLDQGSANETMLGAYGQYKVNATTDLMLGANYRFDDAISPFVGFTHKGLMMGVSYDISTSELGRLANGASSFEVSLTFIGKKKTKTPEIEFVCPRL
jgi:type IX secretion system PorP/SprF family membrane protein